MNKMIEDLNDLWSWANAQHDGGPVGEDEEQDQLLAIMNLSSELIAHLQRLDDLVESRKRREEIQ